MDGEENWQNTDVRKIDVDDYIDRFKNLTIGKYTASSYKTYQSRLNKAKTWYLKFLGKPGWVPPKSSGTNLQKSTIQKVDNTNQNSANSPQIKSRDNNVDSSNQNDLIAYPFPLLSGKIANLYLPVDLSLSDAKRISRFVESLCMESGE